MEFHDLLPGIVRLDILHHAAEGDVYGEGMIEELAKHGYRVSHRPLHPRTRAAEEDEANHDDRP